MSKRPITMLAAVVALAAIAAGCGSSSDDESLTKAQFIKQGSALCKKIEKETRAKYNKVSAQKLKEGKKVGSALGDEMAELVLIPSYRSQVEALEELSPPSDEEDRVAAIYAAADEGIKKVEADPRSLFAFQSDDDPFTKADKLTWEYGFRGCDLGEPG